MVSEWAQVSCRGPREADRLLSPFWALVLAAAGAALERCIRNHRSKKKCSSLLLMQYPVKKANSIWVPVSEAYTFIDRALRKLK